MLLRDSVEPTLHLDHQKEGELNFVPSVVGLRARTSEQRPLLSLLHCRR